MYFSYTFLDFKKLVFDFETAFLNINIKKLNINRKAIIKRKAMKSNLKIAIIANYASP